LDKLILMLTIAVLIGLPFLILIGLALQKPSRDIRPQDFEPSEISLPKEEVRKKRERSPVASTPVPTVVGRAWVIDGDTIDIGGTRIRLAGIDAPELEDPYGVKAKIFMVQLCKGNRIRAEFDGQQSYERHVATCYLPDGRDLSEELVKAGLAIDWPKFSNGKYGQFEVEGIRKKLWRCDARQRGRMPVSLPD
jgi:micrococcal nuclease